MNIVGKAVNVQNFMSPKLICISIFIRCRTNAGICHYSNTALALIQINNLSANYQCAYGSTVRTLTDRCIKCQMEAAAEADSCHQQSYLSALLAASHP